MALAEMDKPYAVLRKRFLEELDKLEGEVSQEGDLDKVLLIRKEKAAAKGEGERPGETFAQLTRLRAIYDQEVEHLDRSRLIELVKALRIHVENLETVKSELTKAGKIEPALEVLKKVKAFEKLLEDPPKIPDGLKSMGYLQPAAETKPKKSESFDPFSSLKK
ncbi:MAG: hypothetical protein KDN19_05320 [Verrucomicrobiae bacterium]|nr:hypothetical protein [Verrucomicrobiae bacterium]